MELNKRGRDPTREQPVLIISLHDIKRPEIPRGNNLQ